MAMGMKYIFAMTWSRPRATKVAVGNQMARILEATSREDIEKNTTASFRSQLLLWDGKHTSEAD